jgi:DNA-binding response OmpR family regulator
MPGDHPRGPVLVVDDDEEMADLYAGLLSDRYAVDVAYEGEAALDRLRERSYDVVLLDRKMPEISGDDVLVTLRDWELDVSVALVTGEKPDSDLLDRGFEEYLLKPVSRETLRATVDDLAGSVSQDALWRELSELRVRKNIMEVECTARELQADEEYQELSARIADLESRLPDSMVKGAGSQGQAAEP